jgi:hypothetical protein
MNWVKTYESFVYEGTTPNDEVDKFEDVIKLTKATGIITSVIYDEAKKILTVELAPKLGSFDVGGVMSAIDKSKSKIKQEYSGVKQLIVGSAVINL